MDEKSTVLSLIKIVLFVILLPLTLIWYIWKKTSWNKRNKWIATAGIAVVFLFIFVSVNENEPISKKVSENTAEVFQVEHVVDGDTVKLTNGQIVRYIGIDTPEVTSSEITSQCFGKEAREKNRELVEGKEVTLTKDVSETDKYDRILRYVYDEDIFVNDYLIRNGFARADNFPPDEKYKDQFKAAQEEAKANKHGLWADDACQN